MVDAKTDCSKQAQVYIVTCMGCQENVHEGPQPANFPRNTEAGGEPKYNYIGMTGTSLHARAASHARDVKYKNLSNALALHIKTAHAGVEQQFTMKSCSTHQTVINRYKTEGVLIESQMVGTSLNSRTEGGRGGLVRIEARVERM